MDKALRRTLQLGAWPKQHDKEHDKDKDRDKDGSRDGSKDGSKDIAYFFTPLEGDRIEIVHIPPTPLTQRFADSMLPRRSSRAWAASVSMNTTIMNTTPMNTSTGEQSTPLSHTFGISGPLSEPISSQLSSSLTDPQPPVSTHESLQSSDSRRQSSTPIIPLNNTTLVQKQRRKDKTRSMRATSPSLTLSPSSISSPSSPASTSTSTSASTSTTSFASFFPFTKQPPSSKVDAQPIDAHHAVPASYVSHASSVNEWRETNFDAPIASEVSSIDALQASSDSPTTASMRAPLGLVGKNQSTFKSSPNLGASSASYTQEQRSNSLSSGNASETALSTTPVSNAVSPVRLPFFRRSGNMKSPDVEKRPEQEKQKKQGFGLGKAFSRNTGSFPVTHDVELKSLGEKDEIPYSTSKSATDQIIIPDKPHFQMLAEQVDPNQSAQDPDNHGIVYKDEYGFPLDEDIAHLQQKIKEASIPKMRKRKIIWQQYIQGLGYNAQRIEKNSQLVAMVRQGIPAELRGQIWQILTGVREYREIYELSYSDMRKKMMEDLKDHDPEDAYQIDKDLCRTFPGHDVINSPELLAALRRVLILYAHFNPQVGYCQSMNFIAATFLMFMSEEDAFWMLGHVIENILPPLYYANDLFGVTVDHKVFMHLIKVKLPKINAHFEQLGVTLESVAFQWFLCLFVNVVPFETSMRVWDSLMCEGNKILFRIALGLLKLMERRLLEAGSLADVMILLRDTPRRFFDADLVMKTGWDKLWIGSFPRTYIRDLRDYFGEIIRGEFALTQQVRGEISSEVLDYDFDAETNVNTAGLIPVDTGDVNDPLDDNFNPSHLQESYQLGSSVILEEDEDNDTPPTHRREGNPVQQEENKISTELKPKTDESSGDQGSDDEYICVPDVVHQEQGHQEVDELFENCPEILHIISSSSDSLLLSKGKSSDTSTSNTSAYTTTETKQPNEVISKDVSSTNARTVPTISVAHGSAKGIESNSPSAISPSTSPPPITPHSNLINSAAVGSTDLTTRPSMQRRITGNLGQRPNFARNSRRESTLSPNSSAHLSSEFVSRHVAPSSRRGSALPSLTMYLESHGITPPASDEIHSASVNPSSVLTSAHNQGAGTRMSGQVGRRGSALPSLTLFLESHGIHPSNPDEKVDQAQAQSQSQIPPQLARTPKGQTLAEIDALLAATTTTTTTTTPSHELTSTADPLMPSSKNASDPSQLASDSQESQTANLSGLSLQSASIIDSASKNSSAFLPSSPYTTLTADLPPQKKEGNVLSQSFSHSQSLSHTTSLHGDNRLTRSALNEESHIDRKKEEAEEGYLRKRNISRSGMPIFVTPKDDSDDSDGDGEVHDHPNRNHNRHGGSDVNPSDGGLSTIDAKAEHRQSRSKSTKSKTVDESLSDLLTNTLGSSSNPDGNADAGIDVEDKRVTNSDYLSGDEKGVDNPGNQRHLKEKSSVKPVRATHDPLQNPDTKTIEAHMKLLDTLKLQHDVRRPKS